MKTRQALGVLGWLFAAAGVGCSGGGTETGPSDAGSDAPTVILDGGGEIPVPPDGAAACPKNGSCNYQTNEGCTATQTCVPLPDGNGAAPPGCIGAGAGESGAPCDNFDECAPGFLCAGKQCRKLCCGGDWSGCPSDDERCIQDFVVSDGNGGTIATGGMLCMPVNTCNALTPAACPFPGQTCQIIDKTGATLCLKEGTGDSGEACPCKGGFLCVDKECRRLCKAATGGGEPSCEEGEGICVHFHRDPPGVGECTPTDNGN